MWLFRLLWFLSCIDFYFIFNFSVYINPILLVCVDRSKINVGNIVGFSITVIAWIAIIAWVAIIARLFWSFVVLW